MVKITQESDYKMVNQTSLSEFMELHKEQEEEDRKLFGSGEYEDRETLITERDTVYAGYFIESYQTEVQGKYGLNTVVRITSPTGAKQTLWVNNFEEDHFLSFVRKLESKGVTTLNQGSNKNIFTLNGPVKVDFLRTQQESDKGNTYNRLMLILKAHGEEVQFELDSL